MTQDPIRPFYAMEILARARALESQGRSIAHLEIGEPGGMPAPAVRKAARECLEQPMGYTTAKGLGALRENLSCYYANQHGASVDPEQIVVTMGSSSGFILSFLAAFPPGATIAVTRPGYPAYLNILASLNFNIVEIPLTEKNGWAVQASDVEKAYGQTPFDGLLVASPANPTGAVLDKSGLTEIIASCDRLGVRFLSDEIYHGLNYAGPDASALEVSADHIVINSFSKYYCMTGWRIGWLVLPPDVIRRAEMMAQSLFISASSVSQYAALAALDCRDFYDAQRDGYARNRKMLFEGLGDIGFGATKASNGAFYAYVDASPFTNDSMDFCLKLLEEAGVAATPGVDFDRENGHKFVRFSYAGTSEAIEIALERMRRFLS